MGEKPEDTNREHIENAQLAAGLGRREKIGSAGEYYPIDTRQEDVPFIEDVSFEKIRKALKLDRLEEIFQEGLRRLRELAVVGNYIEFYKIFEELRQDRRVVEMIVEYLRQQTISYPFFSGETPSSWKAMEFQDFFDQKIREPYIFISNGQFRMSISLMEAIANIKE